MYCARIEIILVLNKKIILATREEGGRIVIFHNYSQFLLKAQCKCQVFDVPD